MRIRKGDNNREMHKRQRIKKKNDGDGLKPLVISQYSTVVLTVVRVMIAKYRK